MVSLWGHSYNLSRYLVYVTNVCLPISLLLPRGSLSAASKLVQVQAPPESPR